MAEEETGISRCGISGLYDQYGNPAALASGWLQQVYSAGTGRLRHRYFALAPTYLAIFSGEYEAGITDEGFLLGLTSADGEVPEVEPVGVSVPLADVATVTAGGDSGTTLVIDLREGVAAPSLDGGAPARRIAAECANADIAAGWAGAITAQVAAAPGVEVPPRAHRSEQPPRAQPAAAAAAAVAQQQQQHSPTPAALTSPGRGGSSGFGFGSKLLGSAAGSLRNLLGGGSGGREPDAVRSDEEYVALDAWAARGVDLEGKGCAKYWVHGPVGGRGCPEAAVLAGWLTKRNKSGLAKGLVEKERFFVLTPTCLAFFADERVAGVTPEGYMTGRAEGSTTGLFGKTGARMPLESVCEVRVLAPNGQAVRSSPLAARRAAPGRSRRKGGSGRRGARGSDGDDDEEDDGEEDEEGGDSNSSRRGGGAGASSSSSAPGVVLFEIDFGDSSLVCNAHNEACRASWVAATRKWAGIRKKAVDEEMFAIGEFSKKKAAEEAEEYSD